MKAILDFTYHPYVLLWWCSISWILLEVHAKPKGKALTKQWKVFEPMILLVCCNGKSSIPLVRSEPKAFISLSFDSEMVFLIP